MDPRIGTELAGYRIEQLLGRGGMSVVYLATDTRLERKVALKVLGPELADNPGFRERFIRESKLAASLDHPNVIPVYEAGEAEGVLFIAMRYVRGTDLRTVIERDGALDPARVVSIVEQVAAALDTAHSEGLVHRDVKPANVLMVGGGEADRREHVYLSDFGVTKRRLSAGGLTATGQLVGTVDYVAPEQIRGEAVDGRADVYSLGCMTFECLTGHAPFERDTEVAVLWAQVQTPPPAATDIRPDLPPGTDAVLVRAMAKSPEDRPATAGAFARHLAVSSAAGTAGPPEARVERRSRRARALMAAAVAVALVAGGMAFALTRSGGDDGSPPSQEPSPSASVAIGGGMQRIDATTGKLIGGVDVAPGPSGSLGVSSLSVGEGFLWAMTRQGLVKINERGVALGTIRVGTAPETVFARVTAGEGAVWVLRDSLERGLVRIDPTTNRIVAEIPAVRGRPVISTSPLAAGLGAVWLAGEHDRMLRIDPASNRIVASVKLPAPADGVAVGEEAVWIRSNGAVASLIRVDPATERVVAHVQLPGGADGFAVGGGSVWVTDSTNDTLIKFDPASNSISRTIPVGPNPQGITVDPGGAVWVYNSGDGTVWEVTGAGNVAAKIELPVARTGTSLPRRSLVAGFDSIWVF
ncbi:MAG TPA: protein kinase [Actinomycetota bacterium]|nr:protein kinase [Actinomycetota bacterium]